MAKLVRGLRLTPVGGRGWHLTGEIAAVSVWAVVRAVRPLQLGAQHDDGDW